LRPIDVEDGSKDVVVDLARTQWPAFDPKRTPPHMCGWAPTDPSAGRSVLRSPYLLAFALTGTRAAER
jgi:hypothetical protein